MNSSRLAVLVEVGELSCINDVSVFVYFDWALRRYCQEDRDSGGAVLSIHIISKHSCHEACLDGMGGNIFWTVEISKAFGSRSFLY